MWRAGKIKVYWSFGNSRGIGWTDSATEKVEQVCAASTRRNEHVLPQHVPRAASSVYSKTPLYCMLTLVPRFTLDKPWCGGCCENSIPFMDRRLLGPSLCKVAYSIWWLGLFICTPVILRILALDEKLKFKKKLHCRTPRLGAEIKRALPHLRDTCRDPRVP